MWKKLVLISFMGLAVLACSTSQAPSTNSPNTGVTGNLNATAVAMTKDDCDALEGTVVTDTVCESGSKCVIRVDSPQTVKGYVEKERCIAKKQ